MSAIHSLLRRFPFPMSGRSSSSSGLYVPSNYSYDYAIGGTPFLSAASDTRPDTESPVPQRKDQFDNYKDPGEYSLNQWWLRSQTSFVGGAGVVYQDPDTQGQPQNIRFHHSIGVDPFSDIDNLQLQRRVVDTGAVTPESSVAAVYATAYAGGSGNDLWACKGLKVWSYSVNAGSLTSRGSVTLGGTGAIQKGIPSIDFLDINSANYGRYAYVEFIDFGGASTNGLWQIREDTPPTARRIYVLPDTSLYDGCLTKARGLLAYGRANKLYLLDPYAATDTVLPTENAQVPADQVITDIADGPDAVYVSANSGTQGYIYKSTFDSAGVVNGLTLVAVMPNGEKINNIAAYVATYLVISTETGIRVGAFTGTGIDYGPPVITVETAGIPDKGFGRIAFWNNNAYVATLGPAQHDGSVGLMAVNLSTLITDSVVGAQFNAYCTWTFFPGNVAAISDVTVTTDGRTVQCSGTSPTGAKVFLEHATELVESGYLDTGRCRFNTIEPKLFKYFSIRTPGILEGDVSIALIDDNGNLTNYITYGPTLDPGTDDVATPIPTGPHIYESLRFTLRRNTVNLAVGGKLDSWQIKALPGTLKQREIVKNFLCFNEEKDKGGNKIKGDTQALDKLTAIRQMCQRGDTVTLQDLANNISDQVVIDDYQFTMLSPPGPDKENYGGYLTVKMRTVADSVPPISPAGSVEEE